MKRIEGMDIWNRLKCSWAMKIRMMETTVGSIDLSMERYKSIRRKD